MMSVLDKGRVGIAALAVGIAQAGLEAALDYARSAASSASRSPRFQGCSGCSPTWRRTSRRRALWSQSGGDAGSTAASRRRCACSMAKCFASDMAVAHTANAVQIFGGSGYIRGFEVERLYRDAKITPDL